MTADQLSKAELEVLITWHLVKKIEARDDGRYDEAELHRMCALEFQTAKDN